MSYNPEFASNGQERGFNDAVIVSCGIGTEYQEALQSTRLHCEKNVPEAWRLFYRDYPLGCPSQEEAQYAFKIFALRRAMGAGFRTLLWMDSCFQPLRSIQPLWEEIREKGWYVPQQGDAMLSEWCSDEFLERTSTKRSDVEQVHLVYSGIVGLDMYHPVAKRIWQMWESMYGAGLFNGCHLNKPGEPREPWGLKWQGHVSDDPGVRGHRHDESALSLVLHLLGLTPRLPTFLTLGGPGGSIGHHVKLVCP